MRSTRSSHFSLSHPGVDLLLAYKRVVSLCNLSSVIFATRCNHAFMDLSVNEEIFSSLRISTLRILPSRVQTIHTTQEFYLVSLDPTHISLHCCPIVRPIQHNRNCHVCYINVLYNFNLILFVTFNFWILSIVWRTLTVPDSMSC